MTRQAIVVFAVLLGAGLAGLLWYQLTRSPADEVAVVSQTPVVTMTPTALPQQTTPESTETPVPVSNTAPTGFGETALLLTTLATLAGGYGLRRSFQGGNF